MRKRILRTLTIICLLYIPLGLIGVVNTSVSIKYETENKLTDCISLVTGTNLCWVQNALMFSLLFCVLYIVIVTLFWTRLTEK